MGDSYPTVLTWLQDHFTEILVGAIPTLLAGIGGLIWAGGPKGLYRRYKLRKGLLSYRKALFDDCSTLPVIGRRQGFLLKDVFVNLDLAPSDLMSRTDDLKESLPQTFVLVGGPGAGKSTVGKKRILVHLQ